MLLDLSKESQTDVQLATRAKIVNSLFKTALTLDASSNAAVQSHV